MLTNCMRKVESIDPFFNKLIFMPPPTKWPEALCFRVVRPYVRPSVPFSFSRYLKNRLMDKFQTWYEYTYMYGGHEVKGQGHRAQYICKNSM